MALQSLNKVFNLAGAVTSAALLSQAGSSQVASEQGNQVLVDVQPASEQMVQAVAPQSNLVRSRIPSRICHCVDIDGDALNNTNLRMSRMPKEVILSKQPATVPSSRKSKVVSSRRAVVSNDVVLPANQNNATDIAVDVSLLKSQRPKSMAEGVVEVQNQTAPPTSEIKAEQVKSAVRAPHSRIADIPVDTPAASLKPTIQSRQSRQSVSSRRSRLASKLLALANSKSLEAVSEDIATRSTPSRPENTTIVVENKVPSKVRANISKSATNVQINTTPDSLECVVEEKPRLDQKRVFTTIRITDKAGHPKKQFIRRPKEQRLVVNLKGDKSSNRLDINSGSGNISPSPAAVSMMGSDEQQSRNTIVMAQPNTNVSIIVN